MLYPVLGCPVEVCPVFPEKHGHTGVSPAKDQRDDEQTGECDLCDLEVAESGTTVEPREEKRRLRGAS